MLSADKLDAWKSFCARDARNRERNCEHKQGAVSQDIHSLAGVLYAHHISVRHGMKTALHMLRASHANSVHHAAAVRVLSHLVEQYRQEVAIACYQEFERRKLRGDIYVEREFFDSVTFDSALRCELYTKHVNAIYSPTHKSLRLLRACLLELNHERGASIDAGGGEDVRKIQLDETPSMSRVLRVLGEMAARLRTLESGKAQIAATRGLRDTLVVCGEAAAQCSERLRMQHQRLAAPESLLEDIGVSRNPARLPPLAPLALGRAEQALERYLSTAEQRACADMRQLVHSELQSLELELQREQTPEEHAQREALQRSLHDWFDDAHGAAISRVLHSESQLLLDAAREWRSQLEACTPDAADAEGLVVLLRKELLPLERYADELSSKLRLLDDNALQCDPALRRNVEASIRASQEAADAHDLTLLRFDAMRELKPLVSSESFFESFSNAWRKPVVSELKRAVTHMQSASGTRASARQLHALLLSLVQQFAREAGASRERSVQLALTLSERVMAIARRFRGRAALLQSACELTPQLECSLANAQEDDFQLPAAWLAQLPPPTANAFAKHCGALVPCVSLLYAFLAQSAVHTQSGAG